MLRQGPWSYTYTHSHAQSESLPPPSYAESMPRTSQPTLTAPQSGPGSLHMDFAQQLALAMQDENVRNAIAQTLAQHRLTPEPRLNTPTTPSHTAGRQ